MRKKKIAHAIRAFQRGGAEILLKESLLNSSLNEQLSNNDLIILDKKRLGLANEVSNRKIYKFHIFSIIFFVEYYKLFKLLKREKYDIIHVHLPNTGIIFRLLKFTLPKTKIIYSEHSLVTQHRKFSYFLNGLTYFLNDYVIFVSAEVEKAVKDSQHKFFFKIKDGSVVINGVNPEKFSCELETKTNKDKLVVGTIVSMRKMKRLDLWVRVVEEIKKAGYGNDIHFIIGGDGPERKNIEEIIKNKNLTSNIKLLGTVTNTVKVFCSFDIFLMTSDHEGLPISLLEAMSCTNVPIVRNVGGIRSLDFKNFGHKIENFNAKEITDVIIDYYKNSKKLRSEQLLARNYVIENNSLNKQVEKYISIYYENI